MNTTTTEVIKRLANYQFMKYAEFPDENSETDCLVWHGSMNGRQRNAHTPQMRMPETWVSVRRYAWNLVYSQLDTTARLRNVCGSERCVNPDHHTRTDKFCKFGHALVGDNLHIQYATDSKTGNRYSHERCRHCGRDKNNLYRGKQKANA